MDDSTMILVNFFSTRQSTKDSRFKETETHLASVTLPWAVVKDASEFRLNDTLYKTVSSYLTAEPLGLVVFLQPIGGTYPVIGAATIKIPDGNNLAP